MASAKPSRAAVGAIVAALTINTSLGRDELAAH